MDSFESSIERFERLKQNKNTDIDTAKYAQNEEVLESFEEESDFLESSVEETFEEDFESEVECEVPNECENIMENTSGDFETTAKSLKNSMGNIFGKIKCAMNQNDTVKVSTKNIEKIEFGSEGNGNLLEIINNKLDILISINNHQSSKLDEITSEIDNVLNTIDENSERIIDSLDAQNIKLSGLLTLLQEIYEGVQDIKYILKNFTPENIDKASNVVDKLKSKIDNYMYNTSKEAEA